MAEQGSEQAETGIDIRSIGEDVIVVSCTVASRLRTPPKLETLAGEAPAPLTSLRFPLKSGGTRVLWAFRRSADRDYVFRAHAGLLGRTMLFEVRAGEQFRPFDFAGLVPQLEPRNRVSLVSALLGVWSSAFKLRRSQSFVRAMRKVADALSPDAAVASIEAGLADGQALIRTLLPAELGEVQAIYVLTPTAVEYVQRRWRLDANERRGKRRLDLIGRGSYGANDRLLIVCAGGIAVRRLASRGAVPSLAGWWRAHGKAGDQIREFIVRALADVSAVGRAASLEFQIRAPLKPKAANGGGGLPSATIELALSGPSGLLAAGWYRDPANFVSGVEVYDENGEARPLDWHRYPVAVAGKPATGFVGFAAAAKSGVPILQPRFLLKFLSGSSQLLIPKPQPLDPVERRGRALKAVSPQHLGDDVLAAIAPAIGDLHAAARAAVGTPSTEAIGEPIAAPEASVVIPLYRNMEFLQAQIAAFATDPVFRGEAEIVFVLDSPEQASDVRQHLLGLQLIYGLACTLVTMERNGGYAAACNAGAKASRGAILAMLNSDVIPAAPGWLGLLAGRLGSRVGAAGPKLLFEDGSIQHAGLYFAQNHFGHWLNHHFHKGMPRDFAAANIERRVPAVTGACLVVRRALFEAVGGFSEDYVIGDYEDSDLCLKIRKAGHEIVYVPTAELYHLERQSIRRSADYMLGVADRYNAWLHASRWREVMAAAGTSEAGAAASLRTAA